MLICIDPGHGGNDPGAVSVEGHLEKDNNLAIAKIIKDQESNLQNVNFIYTRLEDKRLGNNTGSDLGARVKIANDSGADLFISIHQNADPNNKGRGVETYYFADQNFTSTEGKKLAQSLQQAVLKATGLTDRGIKPGSFYVLRNTFMPAVLVEAGFIGGDPNEAKYVSLPDTVEKIAKAILKGIADYLEIDYQESEQEPGVEGTVITGEPVVNKTQAEKFIREKAPDWVFLVDIYYSLGAVYGIRADIALAQACKETNYFKFTGIVKPEFNNYCGLKTEKAQGDTPSDHARFPDPATGVEAHIQHLYCYATQNPLPEDRTLVDPRFNIVAEIVGRGTATTVEELSGKWAPSSDYGKSIVRDYMQKMLSFYPDNGDPGELQKEINKLQQELDSSKREISKLENKVAEMNSKLKEIARIISPYS
jgi:N-acetylmuramoyl-L-alanine amidase